MGLKRLLGWLMWCWLVWSPTIYGINAKTICQPVICYQTIDAISNGCPSSWIYDSWPDLLPSRWIQRPNTLIAVSCVLIALAHSLLRGFVLRELSELCDALKSVGLMSWRAERWSLVKHHSLGLLPRDVYTHLQLPNLALLTPICFN